MGKVSIKYHHDLNQLSTLRSFESIEVILNSVVISATILFHVQYMYSTRLTGNVACTRTTRVRCARATRVDAERLATV